MASRRRVAAGAASRGFNKSDMKVSQTGASHVPKLEHDHAEQKCI
jgi:hypothetical protein